MQNAGFIDGRGKGSHGDFAHPNVTRPVTVSGKTGNDEKSYQHAIKIQATDNSVSILTESDTSSSYHGQRAIICTDVWVNDLLTLSFNIKLDVELWHID